MVSIASSENVFRVESLTEKDPKPTYTKIWDIMKTSSISLTRILKGCLGVGKLFARRVPFKHSQEKKLGGVDWCTHMLSHWEGVSLVFLMAALA